MAHIAIQHENKSSFLSASGNTSAVNHLKTESAKVFDASALFVLKPSPAIAAKKGKKLSYLATKRNLLLVTIAYMAILASVLFAVL